MNAVLDRRIALLSILEPGQPIAIAGGDFALIRREVLRWTQGQMACAMGVRLSTISTWERLGYEGTVSRQASLALRWLCEHQAQADKLAGVWVTSSAQ